MRLKAVRFTALLFTALTLGPSLAHLLELPNKIGLSRADYLTVQQIYSGWALLGIVVIGALLSTLILTVMVRARPRTFRLNLAAFLCLAAAHAVFWMFTYPANQATENWTTLPADWQQLRAQWEYSHATGAILNLIAFTMLVLSVLAHDE